jgi:hypothetical protein
MARPAVLLLSAVALAGCSPSTLDTAETERAIRASVTERFDASVEAVTCPDDVEAEEGGTFRCTVRAADGSSGRAVVLQQDDENVVRTPFLRVAGVERLVSREFAEQSAARRVRIACPDIVEARAGGTFACRARAGRRTARIRVTQSDVEGRVRWERVAR